MAWRRDRELFEFAVGNRYTRLSPTWKMCAVRPLATTALTVVAIPSWWQNQRFSAFSTRAADVFTVQVSGVARYSSMKSVTAVWLACSASAPLETPSAIMATAPFSQSGGDAANASWLTSRAPATDVPP